MPIFAIFILPDNDQINVNKRGGLFHLEQTCGILLKESVISFNKKIPY